MATKTIKKKQIRHAGLCLLLVLVATPIAVSLTTAAPESASADSAPASQSLVSTVAQSYNAAPNVLTGMLVWSKDQSTVIPVDTSNIHKMSGVVAPIDGADIVLTSPNAQSRQVLVAPTGRYNVLVSNQNGPVKAGDYLSISALAGIAMEADSDQPEVVGRAAGSFNGKANILETVKLKSDSGQTSTAAIGYIQADIRLAPNPLHKNSNYVPGILARAVQGVTDKPVSAARIYLSIAVVVATFFVTGSMVYGGMRGSMTAIGRNPLAKGVVSRGMIQSVIFGMIVFLLGVLAAYGLLL